MSQNFEIGPGSLFIKSRKKYVKKMIKSYPFFVIKYKIILKTKT